MTPIAGTGIDANRREEVDEQDVPRPQFELHRIPRDEIEQTEQDREEESARNRLRDVEFTQETDPVIQPLADKQHDDADGHGEKGINAENAFL
jgi:hypothetical protein